MFCAINVKWTRLQPLGDRIKASKESTNKRNTLSDAAASFLRCFCAMLATKSNRDVSIAIEVFHFDFNCPTWAGSDAAHFSFVICDALLWVLLLSPFERQPRAFTRWKQILMGFAILREIIKTLCAPNEFLSRLKRSGFQWRIHQTGNQAALCDCS